MNDETRQKVTQAVVEELRARPEVTGIVLARPGSGRYDETSDLDFYVLLNASWRQRLQFIRDGAPVEVFMNPPAQVERDFREGETATIGMLAFGQLLFDRDGETEPLLVRARARWEQGPDALDENASLFARYAIVDALDDARDMLEQDPAAAMLAINETLRACVHYLYADARRWRPKAKNLPPDLDIWHPIAAAVLRKALKMSDPVVAWMQASRLAWIALGEEPRVFAWESGQVEVR